MIDVFMLLIQGYVCVSKCLGHVLIHWGRPYQNWRQIEGTYSSFGLFGGGGTAEESDEYLPKFREDFVGVQDLA